MKAGEGIRTLDIQLGKSQGATAKTVRKPRAFQELGDQKDVSQGFARHRVFSTYSGYFRRSGV
jgi:hypothetical protein